MKPEISVIICTHNPRKDYLRRAIDGLKQQTLPLDCWEFLVIDNLSSPSIESICDVGWHSDCRILVESELGILPARVRGLGEARADHILFLDDDNVLDPDYLEAALQIGNDRPFLGAWGGGQIHLEYETPPPAWIKEFEYLFTALDLKEEQWAKMGLGNPVMPPTMGMCLRRVVADQFLENVRRDSRRKLLGRRGKKQFSNCEDNDLALTACDLGFGTGQFPQMALTHLIPATRLTADYIFSLYEGTVRSAYILQALRGRPPVLDRLSAARRWIGRMRRKFFFDPILARMTECRLNARQQACEVVAQWQSVGPMSSPRMTQAQSPASHRKIRIAYIGWVRPGPRSGASLALQRHLYGGGEFEVFVGTHTAYAGLGLPERWQSLSRTKIHERALRTRFRRVLAQYEMLLEPVLFAKQIERAVREFAPDVILTVPDNTLSWAAYLLSRKLGLPLVSNFQDWWPRGQIHSLLETPYAWVRRMLETRFRKIYQESVVAFCTSEGFRKFLGPHPCAPLLYPCPADRPSPRPSSAPPHPDRQIKVVYGGTLFRYYGEKMLALAKVTAPNPSIDLRLFGGTPDWSAQDLDWAKKSGIYRGLLTNDEFRRELLEADVLIAAMTSAPELEIMMRTSFTTKFIEYCQFAKPVIIWGPEYCEPVRVALETGAGLAVTDESPEVVVEKILGLRDPDIFQSLADGAWNAATTFFDPQSIHSTFVDAIHRVIIERK